MNLFRCLPEVNICTYEKEGWSKLHKEELHNLFSSPNTIRVIRSKRMGGTEHVMCMGEMTNTNF